MGRQRGREGGASFGTCTYLCSNSYSWVMALVISPPALPFLADQSLRFCTRDVFFCCRPGARCKRRIQAVRSTDLPIREVDERSPPALQTQTSSGGGSRRRFVAILLSSSLSLSQFFAFGENGSSAAVADADIGPFSGAFGSSSGGVRVILWRGMAWSPAFG